MKAAFENDYQTATPYFHLSDGIDEHTVIESLNALNQLISLQEDLLSKSKGIPIEVQFYEIKSVEQVDANHARGTYTTRTSITSPQYFEITMIKENDTWKVHFKNFFNEVFLRL